MCNVSQDVLDKFTVTVEQFLESGQMFSAYDVTVETRQRESVQLRHKDCRGVVHNDLSVIDEVLQYGFDDANGNTREWQRSSVSHPQTGQPVFVYHPADVDPTGFQFRGPQAAQAQSAALPKTAPSDDGNISDGGGANSDGSFSTDYRNRLLIRLENLRDHLGLNSNDNCYVVQDPNNNRILLAGANIDNGSGFTQRVSRQSNFYLSSQTLRGAKMDVTETFAVERSTVDGENVVIVTQFS